MAREGVSAYSTQAKISLRVADLIHQRRISLWFSREFNPIENGVGSNPLKIFEDLDTASKQSAHNSKTQSVQRNLLKWVRDMAARDEIEGPLVIEVTQLIRAALESGQYSPVVLFLNEVETADRMGEPDEYWVSSQRFDEPERVSQILPPRD